MRDPSRVRVGGPLRRYAGGFREELEGQGYSPSTVVLHLQLMGHLSGWLAGEGLSGAALTGAQVDRYLAGRRSAGLACHRTRRSLLPLLGYLGGLGVLSAPAVSEPVPEVLAGYADYLRYERGLADSTIRRNVELVEPLVATLASGGEFGWERLDGAAVSAFVVAHCRGRADGGGSPARMFTALRSLLRFVHLAGLVGTPLVDAVPSVPCRRLAGLPKALSVEQVAALLGSCDTGTMVGRRDRAIITMLARLGLRAGEVAALRLDDIDWRNGEITLRGKGNRSERLPLPVDVGRAVVAYLTAERPATTTHRELFGRVRAPHGPLTRLAVTQLVARAAGRAGLAPVYAHQLRHTAATEMLRRGGSLTEIGQVLRHRRALTTAVYAKVDIEALRLLARPWPGGVA